MSIPYSKPSRPKEGPAFPRHRGVYRGSGYVTRGNGGQRSNRHGSGGLAGRPCGDAARGGYSSFRGGLRWKPPMKEKSRCVVCGTGEVKYKFRCCSRHFCSTGCYKQHMETPCKGPAQDQRQGHQAAPPVVPGVSEAAPPLLTSSIEAAAFEVTAPGPGQCVVPGLESSLHPSQENQQLISAADTLGPSMVAHERRYSSGDSETESGEASSDESDISETDKPSKCGSRKRFCGLKFESLSASEQDMIRKLFTRPEMQSTALREAIRSVVMAASRGPGAEAAALFSNMQHPEFAAFADLLMETLEGDEAAEVLVQPSATEQLSRRRRSGETESRYN